MGLERTSGNLPSTMKETWFTTRTKKSVKDIVLPTISLSYDVEQELHYLYVRSGGSRDLSGKSGIGG